MTMILNLDALQLNVSPFGRKYLQNNGIHDMARLRTIAYSISVLPAEWRFLFLGAATELHDDDSEFGCFTIECFILWAEIPAKQWYS